MPVCDGFFARGWLKAGPQKLFFRFPVFAVGDARKKNLTTKLCFVNFHPQCILLLLCGRFCPNCAAL